MAHAQVVTMVENWQQWEGRIVNGEFPLRQYLGGSEESAVYLTEIQGARAAIKLIEADAPQAQAQAANWKLAARLSHPNLVGILQAGLWHADDQQDMLFAIMEYCDESLEGVLRQRPLTPAETREMLAPALDALSYLHGQDLVHGEIKPANILAAGDQLKLSSDGIRRAGNVNSSAADRYDGPEGFAGTVGVGVDIWSLGMTLVESLTDGVPERDSNGDPKLAEGLPAPFDVIVQGCLAKDPANQLSLTEIRKLLDERDVTRRAEAKGVHLVATAAVVAPEIRLTNPVRSNVDLSATTIPVDPGFQSKTQHDVPAVDGRRVPVLIGAALVVVLAIVGGLRLLRPSSDISQTTSAARQDAVSSAPVTKGPAAGDNAPVIVARPANAAPGAVSHQVMPEVTTQARNSINGTVKVKVGLAVDARGKVSRASLVGAGPSKYFSRQAVEAARQWTFNPPVQEGKPQASTWTVNFEFRRGGTKANARPTHPV